MCLEVDSGPWPVTQFLLTPGSSLPSILNTLPRDLIEPDLKGGISLYLALWHKIVLETGTRHKLFLQSLQIHGKNIISKMMREKLESTVLRFYPTGKEERVSVLDIKGQELLKTKGVRHHQVLILFNIFPDDSHWSSIKTQCVTSISSSYILRWL